MAVTCHEDVEAWLNPDWVYRPAEELFTWRFLQRRPVIEIDIVRCGPSAWRLFAPHHYLSAALARSADVLPGHLARSARRVLGLAPLCRQRPEDAP